MASDVRTGDLPAGDFASWLDAMQAALRGESDAEVPCGSCTACCTSSQFVPIGPDETDTLAHIPAELLFPAPRLAKGHVLLGYDERGHCPMLVDGRCSIYEHRPRTCRTYDCRIFTATGLDVGADDPTKDPIAERSRQWQFTFPTDDDQRRQTAVHASVRTVHATSVTQLAVTAIERYEEFLAAGDPSPTTSGSGTFECSRSDVGDEIDHSDVDFVPNVGRRSSEEGR